MKLYEFSASIRVHTVVAAESEEAARAALADFSAEWWVKENGNSDVIDVGRPDLFDVREPDGADLKDESHLVAN